jgi:hypothetical protein
LYIKTGDMNKIRFFNIKSAGLLLFTAICMAVLITSCDKDDQKEYTGTPYFNIEGDPTGLTAGVNGVTQSYTVRSNRPWQIVAQGEDDWVKAFPDEGEGDGIFKMIVSQNDSFDERIMNFAFVVNGEEQPVLFRVDQEGNVPYIIAPEDVAIIAAGEDVTIDVNSNVEWDYSLSDDSWLTEKSVSSTQLVLTAGENISVDERVVTLTVTAVNYPAVSQEVTLTQSPGTVVLEENFNWLAYGSAIFYTTTGETRYDNWTQEEKDRGWVSEPSTVDGSGLTPLCYARQGFFKLGKTGYGGDIYSPPLAKIVGTQDVVVTFKAIPYQTAAGTRDDNFLNISIIGPGTISQGQFIIDNWPAYPTDGVEEYCNALWSEPEATRTFTITGATSATQIKFLGGDYALVGVGAGKNRIFIDDVKVELVVK